MKNIIIAFILLLSYSVSAQENNFYSRKKIKSINNNEKYRPLDSINDLLMYKKNAISFELLGNGFFPGSINYERNLDKNKNGFVTLRIGCGANVFSDGFSFPILLNQVIVNNPNNHFEIGGGLFLPFSKWRNKISLDTYYFSATANLMYRYQKPDGHFIGRIGWTPIIPLNSDRYNFDYGVGTETVFQILWIGGSLGFVF